MRPSFVRITARAVEKGDRAQRARPFARGFSTKINARTNADGLPIGIEITPGQFHDVTAYPALMNDIDCDPEQMLGGDTTAKPFDGRSSSVVARP